MAKTGKVKSLTASDDDMAKINSLTLDPLDKESVYAFKVVACDNDIDRDWDRFDEKALQALAEKLVGRTVIKDHARSADNQFARIYDAEVTDGDGLTQTGEPLRELSVKCFTLDNEANAQMISEIKAGIKKEVSISFMPGSMTCSACGTDRRKHWCSHRAGEEYEGRMCHCVLSDIEDAYEMSFVAVPAQRAAGTRKDFMVPEESAQEEGKEDNGEEAAKAAFSEREKQIALAEAYLAIR